MTNKIPTDQELDMFFNELRLRLPPQSFEINLPEPSEELLDLAWQATQTHRAYLFDHGLFQETVYLKAAASGGEQDMPFQLDSIGGEWSITREIFPGNNEWQMLKFRCRPEFQDLYERRRVTATIAGQTFDLGEVFDCVAKAEIPKSLDLTQGINIDVGRFVEEGE